MQLNSGIYKIQASNGIFYIGSSVNLRKRKINHFNTLKRKKHHNNYLQNYYNKHGQESLKFEILVTCPKEYLIKMEQWFLDNLKPKFNFYKKAYSPLGFKLSQDHKDKISKANKGKPKPPGFIENLKRINTGRVFAEEHINKLKIARSKRGLHEFPQKLQIEQVVKIKELIKEKKTLTSIAKEFGVSIAMISRIKLGLAWTDIN